MLDSERLAGRSVCIHGFNAAELIVGSHMQRLRGSHLSRACVAWGVASVLVLGGCSLLTSGDKCETVLLPAVLVRVRDVRSGQFIGSQAILVTVNKTSGVADTARGASFDGGDSLPLQGGSTPGTFDLAVTRPGYSTWKRTDVVVGRGIACRPETVSLEALLAKL